MLSTKPTKNRMAMTWLVLVTAARQNVRSWVDLLGQQTFEVKAGYPLTVHTSSQLGIQILGQTFVRIICEGICPTT